MKPCAYCGRENQDEATHCVECGTAEFVPATPPVPPEKFGPMISRQTKAVCLGAAIVLFVILFVGPRMGLTPSRPAVLTAICFLGNMTSTPAGLGFVVSNRGDSVIVYLAYPPQVISNGLWTDGPRPAGPARMLTLAAHQVVTNVVAAPTQGGPCRVPVLWGYQPTHWQWIKHRALTLLSGRDSGFTLETYTNFSNPISMP
jgi:hypothetical protein